MPKLIVVLGDQLSPALASLQQLQPDDVILLAEVASEASYVRHHKHKIILLFSAMRHFATTLQQLGYPLCYIRYGSVPHLSTMTDAVQFALAQHTDLTSVVITECGEYRLQQEILSWQHQLSLPVHILSDDRFICDLPRFSRWAKGKKQLRMEYFYREMRRYTGLLMQAETPEGGKWNYDADNRKTWPDKLQPTAPLSFPPDDITADVIALVKQHFADNMGRAENFHYAVCGKDARQAFLHFVQHQLPQFGDYQDAMRLEQPFLQHSICSVYLNCGLLDVRWMCNKVQQAYQQGLVPLNAAEGFIRQLIGWREYVRGLYWLLMPNYKQRNTLEATRALPGFYWHGQTKMRCMQQAVQSTIEHAYSHHIQRLMITGNFALLAGLSVEQVTDWYLAVYADAYEWVELPNTLGMALFADGGVLASKPYAASGAYINRMSNYCKHCAYNVKRTTEADACPFNALYWDFLQRNQAVLAQNPRLTLAYTNWHKRSDTDKAAILAKAADTLIKLEQL
ncbi:MAG: cryptochrome/photolyase family protein [Gammaproteobacteria bacterium]|nr:cryptochrome/photolyase family protein [Gammaproteobacteria bacterium]MBU1556519.1 cryptochrome/photolyase family protein [Gammaproteobacteria bacterium]MBU2071334.1 cryptochrome/photolyase family protein [Gammaproteobacteria bacterium]MBU2182506.1 cryptochrome/photolyase family protein [Gammaproteobacteria bacterium]MBU2204666.1 cryptochrome/photolyase family protein [Gammaproteobacteria bacterium]